MISLENLIQNNLLIILVFFIILFLILLAWNIFFYLQFQIIKKEKTILFAGKKVKNLEELLLSQAKSLQLLDKDIQELYNISNQINNLAFKSFHKIGQVRFNPFKDVGGNQSFSIALLNGKNDGITLSSLFTREGARIYSKEIINGQSEKHPLTEEEKEAIKKAIATNKTS